MKARSLLVPLALLASPALAQTPPGPDAVAAPGERTLRHEAVVAAPVADVWAAFTTKEGIESWMVPRAEIDLRVGGRLRTSYSKTSTLEDEHTIVHEILAYEPPVMLAFRTIQKPKGAEQLRMDGLWCVVRLEPLGAAATRVFVAGLGYGDTAEDDATIAHFERGNAWTLQQLQKRFPARQDAGARVLELLSGLEGEWRHEGKKGDRPLRVRQVIARGPASGTFVARAWLDTGDGEFQHGESQIWREPGTGAIRFQSIDEHGSIARGEIVLDGEHALRWDWKELRQDGRTVAYDVRTSHGQDDPYRFSVAMPGRPKPLVELSYRRAEAAAR